MLVFRVDQVNETYSLAPAPYLGQRHGLPELHSIHPLDIFLFRYTGQAGQTKNRSSMCAVVVLFLLLHPSPVYFVHQQNNVATFNGITFEK